MKVGTSGSLIPILLCLFVTTVHGNLGINNFLQTLQTRSVLDDWLADIILNVVELLRDGLKEEDFGHIPIPKIEWTVDGPNVAARLHTDNMYVNGVTDFNVTRLETEILKLKADIAAELPVLELAGDFDLDGSIIGIPLWGTGYLSIKFVIVDIGAVAQLILPQIGKPMAIDVSKTFLSVGKIVITVDGLMSNIKLWGLLLIILAIGLVVIGVTVAVTLNFWRIKKLFKRKG